MENREEQILSEIRTMMSAIRLQIDSLDAKIAQLQELFGHDEVYEGPIDLDIEDDLPADNADIPAETSPAEAFQQVLPEGLSWSEEPSREEHSLPVQDCLTDEPSECGIPEVAVADETVEFTDVSDDEEDDDDDDDAPVSAPAPEDKPVLSDPAPIYEAAQSSPEKRKAVIDVMADKQTWRTAMPGTGVKDVRSAISLNDRIIFINLLFKTDPMAFQDALTRINAMENLEQVVDYIAAEHPDWDLDSELVYRFMMAVRRKIR